MLKVMADNESINSSNSIESDDQIDDIDSIEPINPNIDHVGLDEDHDEETDFDEEDTDSENNSNSVKITNTDKSIIYSMEQTYNNYYTKDKSTKPILTKFEKAKILGVRSEMLAGGSIPLVKFDKHIDNVYEIAKLELVEKKIPLFIRRTLPNGEFEDWRLDELNF